MKFENLYQKQNWLLKQIRINRRKRIDILDAPYLTKEKKIKLEKSTTKILTLAQELEWTSKKIEVIENGKRGN